MCFDVVVIGGGIIGLLTARELSIAGAKVALVEAGLCGQESSWAGGGIVSPLYPWRYGAAVTALASAAQQAYPALCAALLDSTGIDPQYVKSGLLLLAVSDREEAIAWAWRQNHRMERIAPELQNAIQPGISPGESEALYFPDVAQVRNPRLTKALQSDLRQRQVRIFENTAVSGWQLDGGTVTAVKAQQASQQISFKAEKFVLCAGAWTAQLLAHLQVPSAIKPIRGQMLMFESHSHALQRIVLRDGRYLIPRQDGRILCGSTVEDVGFDKATTEEAAKSLTESAYAMMPSLRDIRIEMQWAGLRPGSHQGIPSIGLLLAYDNLWVNAGHFRNGVVLAPAAARLAADLVMQRETLLDPKPYQLADMPTAPLLI